jgi:predicted membrane channel-forming protein YqfA (hemolysin III family)
LMLISMRFLRVQNLSAITTTPVSHIDIIVLVSRFKPYTSFEKILMPFDEEVWVWLISTLMFLGVFGIVVKLMLRRFNNLVFKDISILHSL